MRPSFVGYDVEAYLIADNLYNSGDFALSQKPLMGLVYNGGVPGLHEKRYGRTGLLEPLLALPFYVVGAVADKLGHFRIPMGSVFLVLALGPMLAALCGALVYLIAVRFYERRNAVSISLIYSVGTMAFPYSSIRSETVLTACFLTMLLGIVKYKHPTGNSGGGRTLSALLAGLGAGAMIATKSYAILLALPGIILFVAIYHKNKSKNHLFAFFLPVLIFGAVEAAYNAIRFGSPFNAGYPATFGFDAVHLVGCIYVLFASPAKCVFIFSPILVAGLCAFKSFDGKNPLWSRFILAETLALVFFISTFREPLLFADEIWGSRYLFPVISLWTIIAGAWLGEGKWRRLAVYVSGAAGFLVSLPGVLVRPEGLYAYSEALCAAPKYCRLLDWKMNAITVNMRLLLGSAPSFMDKWSHPWIWWIQVLRPWGANAVRSGEIIAAITPGVRILAVLAALGCLIAAIIFFKSIVLENYSGGSRNAVS